MFDSPLLRGNTVDLTGGPPRAASPRWYPPLPYTIAVVLLVLSAAASAAFALWPPDGNDHMQTIDTAIAIVLVVAAAMVWRFGPRSRNDWVLDAVTIGVAVLVAGGMPELPDQVGQATVGYGLLLFAVFAAYFRPFRRFLVELLILVSVYAFGLLPSPHPLSPLYFLVASGVMVTSSVMVAVLAHRLREQAWHDSLTGTLNRRGLDLMAAQTRAFALRTGVPLTVGLVDLDDFKTLNDRLGHAAGDTLLVQVSAAWREQLRRTDLIARYGGDEFVVVLPGSTEEAAGEVDRRARESVAASWCAGFVPWDPAEELDAALARADAKLYQAKAKRKDSTV